MSNPSAPEPTLQRLKIFIRGAVQGVGFRPFVYRLAREMQLTGWVINGSHGVVVDVEGEPSRLDAFLLRIGREKPPRSFIRSLESSYLDPVGHASFDIRESEKDDDPTALLLPDIATCPECLEEIFDPANRRHLYPFTNCTNCGPRFTIIESLPYDRPATSMKRFRMCPACEREYRDPADRRFHAQPNACPACGPRLTLWDDSGRTRETDHPALLHAAAGIRGGRIVAVKGIGGFHLLVDARNDDAIRRLRLRKRREEKPFALMYPSLEAVRRECRVDAQEERLLCSAEAPIVLLRRLCTQDHEEHATGEEEGRATTAVVRAEEVAPRNPSLGIMLPYTPLHHILMREFGFPVVATSGNLSDEPICIDELEAVDRLRGIADLFLVHDRPILRHADDSILRMISGREMILRRARGFAPLPLRLPGSRESADGSVAATGRDHRNTSSRCIHAVGAHLKNSVAVTIGDDCFVSQHIGDLETEESFRAFTGVLSDFQGIYRTRPDAVVCDMHPDYLSTKYARELSARIFAVQHHHAHVASCMAENELCGRVLGISWDGTGYGTDGTIWGGEFLLADEASFRRFAHLRTFPLPGGDTAVREPRRAALGLLHEMVGTAAFDHPIIRRLFTREQIDLLAPMLERGINTPRTSSMGRLFDAVAAISGLRSIVRHEGQAAMELEFAIGNIGDAGLYAFEIGNRQPRERSRADDADFPGGLPLVVDWEPMIRELLADVERPTALSVISRRFHNTLVEMIIAAAGRCGEKRVVLSGGCFQNRYLTERAIDRLREDGFRPYWHQRVPPHDGGISLGQAFVGVQLVRAME